jgi:hypothetical protein
MWPEYLATVEANTSTGLVAVAPCAQGTGAARVIRIPRGATRRATAASSQDSPPPTGRDIDEFVGVEDRAAATTAATVRGASATAEIARAAAAAAPQVISTPAPSAADKDLQVPGSQREAPRGRSAVATEVITGATSPPPTMLSFTVKGEPYGFTFFRDEVTTLTQVTVSPVRLIGKSWVVFCPLSS